MFDYNLNYWQNKWDRIAQTQDTNYELVLTSKTGLETTSKYFLVSLEKVPKKIKEKKIIDVGCGPGVYLNLLHKLGYKKLYGVDFSKKIIKKAQSQAISPGIQYSIGETTQLNFPDKTFSLMLSIGVFQYLSQRKSQIKTLKEAYRVLNLGGYFIITTLNRFSLKNVFTKESPDHQRYNPYKFCKLLKKNDFKIIYLGGIYFFPESLSFLNNFILKSKIYKFFNFFFFAFNISAHSFIVVAQKK